MALGAALVTLATVSGCGLRGVEERANADTRRTVVPVTVGTAEQRSLERTVDVVGSLQGWERVTVGAKRIGRVAKIHHDMGDRVKPGELLVEFESVDADLAVRQAERQLQAELAKLGLKAIPTDDFDPTKVPAVVQARVTLERARQHLAREQMLNQRNAGTAQDLQNAENDERAASAALDSATLTARSTLANALAAGVALDVAKQARLDVEIRAPVPFAHPERVTEPAVYAISKRQVGEGEMVKQGEPIAELVIENPLRLRLPVPERFSADVRQGQEVRVRVPAYPGMTFEGKVARINPAVDALSRTFQVEALVPNSRGLLRPGGFAKASIVTDQKAQATVVPLEAIVRFAGVTKLFVVDGEKARAISVETGQEGSGWIEVLGNVPAKARVVVTGQGQLADGTAVAIRQPEAARAATAETANP
jgi:multidrug efflux pump subunit AcrA (membrane-fusion protein)